MVTNQEGEEYDGPFDTKKAVQACVKQFQKQFHCKPKIKVITIRPLERMWNMSDHKGESDVRIDESAGEIAVDIDGGGEETRDCFPSKRVIDSQNGYGESN